MKKKLLKFLLLLILFMLIAIFILRKYVLTDVPIYQKFGSYQPSSISLNDSIHIRTYSTTKYFNLIENEKYELAYQMLTDEYQRYMPYERFVQEVKKYDYSQWKVKNVKQISDITYVITLVDTVSDEEHVYIAYASKFNNKTFTISPEKFIYYDTPNVKGSSKGIECVVTDYLVFQDSIHMNLQLNNTSSKAVTIQDVRVELSLAGRLADKFEAITLEPHEKRNIAISYTETSFYIPKDVLIETPNTTIKLDLQ